MLTELARIIEDEIDLRRHALKAKVLADENAMLAREYHHRVKNTLAVSSALVRLSGREAISVEDLIDKATGRLIALAGAHDSLISASDDVNLQELAARLLRPYSPGASAAEIIGPKVLLRHQQVTPICLFLHELATNAAKYGAFRDQGQVTVRWGYRDDGHVALSWSESLSDGVRPAPAGFGSKLLEIASRQLGGRTSTTWLDDLLTVTLTFPIALPQAT